MPDHVQEAFDAAATKQAKQPAVPKPLWKKALNAFLYTTTGLIAPINFDWKKKKLSLSAGKVWMAVGVAHLVVPMSGHLLPTAEEYLVQEGFKQEAAQAIVNELAPDRDVHVLTDDWKGQVYTFTQQPFLLTMVGWNSVWKFMQEDAVQGFALRDDRKIGAPGPDIIVIKKKDIAADYVETAKVLSVSEKEVEQFIIFHEIRHIADGNHALQEGLERESEASYEAVRVLTQDGENGVALRDRYISYLGVNFSATHDTVLYMDARFNGRHTPDIEKIRSANEVARDFLSNNSSAIATSLTCHFNGGQQQDCNKAWHDNPEISPEAARRIDLFVKAQKARMTRALKAS